MRFLAILLVLAVAPPLFAQKFFHTTGALPAQNSFYADVRSVSGNCRVLSGRSQTDVGWQGYVYDDVTGSLTNIGTTLQGTAGADGLSFDGSRMVRQFFYMDPTTSGWTQLPGALDASTISSDGNVVFGEIYGAPYRWDFGGPLLALTPALEFFGESNADGSAVACISSGGATQPLPAVWTLTSGFTLLPSINNMGGYAVGISPSGDRVVGASRFGPTSSRKAVYWRQQGPSWALTEIGQLNGHESTTATDVAAGGSPIVGYADVGFDEVAFIWTPELGMMTMAQYLSMSGLNVAGWMFESAHVSEDGWTFAGHGRNPAGQKEGWVASVRALFKRGDCNGSGATDIADGVFVLLHLFASTGNPPCADACDANDSGIVDIADAVQILTHLFQSGPLPTPNVQCGVDDTPDATFCATFAPCN
ncbi:MAG: hypothetical protein AAF581_08895 [Planctomycetota bacterium]